ncbi:ABC-F family ATP-binding cassette domain-containing protein [Macrococcoides caseolyticum]|uniref:ABC-F family ATP-binding cassette domain-containing protein n=1 Tax=Macrococcoides caseolyticum TaxID=69966 RepID=UPI001F2465CA|nr:ABC-F family ATP-binding cassette domain-containing protein [Macrococcus caseolyticus]MCE4958033.1 ABC-F family ATP-binding cassette domain-containing protein [Macrococcus caseolyticus]
MILLQASNITKSYSGENIFSNVKFEVKSNDRIAIVGRNGAGKTTLMKILAGTEEFDSGHLSMTKNVKLGYLTQQMTLNADGTVYEAMKKPFLHLEKMQKELSEIAQYLSDESHQASSADYQQKLIEYEKLQHQFETQDGYLYETKIKTVLTGLNFKEEDFHQKIDTFSGGQKTRLALAEMLLHNPDLLLLDEPTNHLDMDTTAWLENYLTTYSGAIVIISHDRYFLDKVVNTVYDVALGQVQKYVGNYSKFIEQRDQFYEKMQAQYERQQAEIKRLETFVQKNITRASTSGMAKSRRKVLQKMSKIDMPKQDDHSMRLRFNIQKETGNDVLRINDLAIGYDTPLAKHLNLDIKKQDAVAFIGPNGIGKTTLIKTIAKQLQALNGDIHYGSNVSIGYYDQKQAEFFSNNTVLEELWQYYPHLPEKEIRTVLGRFLFVQDDVKKIINDLSGGEKARLQLAKLSLEENNVLILDEPTNHLDIDAKEVLEDALIHYPGTLLFVSHDRYFINKIATKVFQMTDKGGKLFLGDYSYFIEKEEERIAHEQFNEQVMKQAQKEPSNNDFKANQKERRKIERQLERTEQDIQQTEAKIADIEEQLTLPEVFNDHEKAHQLNQELIALNQSLEQMVEQWTELELTLED